MTDPASPNDDPVDDAAYRRRLLFAVMLSVMGFGSLTTIVTVALGTLATELDSTRTTLGWAVTGVLLTMAVATPLGGKLGDIRGHRCMFVIGSIASVVTTAACAFAWDATSLIVFRVLFGLSGALVQPAGMSLLMRAYGPQRRATAMGWFQFASTGAPAIGLVIGGPLIDVLGWRTLFLVFAATSLAALVVAVAVVRESPLGERLPLDVLGSVSLGLGILFVLLGVGTTARNGITDPLAPIEFAAAAIAIGTFVVAERRAPYPLLRLEYFGRRRFSAPMLANSLTQFAYMGGFVVTPLLLGDVYGYAVSAVAMIMAPRPGAFAATSPFGGALASRIGERIPMLVAGCCMIASMFSFAAGSAPGRVVFVIGGLLLSGISAGIGQPAYAAMVADSVDEADVGVASGMNQTMLFVGIVSGIQVMLVVLGDDPSQQRFVGTYLFGASVAALGLVAAFVAGARRPATSHAAAAGSSRA